MPVGIYLETEGVMVLGYREDYRSGWENDRTGQASCESRGLYSGCNGRRLPIKEAAGHIKKLDAERSGPKAQERFRISGCEDKTGAE